MVFSNLVLVLPEHGRESCVATQASYHPCSFFLKADTDLQSGGCRPRRDLNPSHFNMARRFQKHLGPASLHFRLRL